jgi:hypothetical protein
MRRGKADEHPIGMWRFAATLKVIRYPLIEWLPAPSTEGSLRGIKIKRIPIEEARPAATTLRAMGK